MRKIEAFTLAEIMVAMLLVGIMALLTLPSMVTNTSEKIYSSGYNKAYKTISTTMAAYQSTPSFYIIQPTKRSVINFIKYFVENNTIKALYAEPNPTKASETYAALTFDYDTIIGAKDPVSVSPMIEIGTSPTFWLVTEDNIAYSVIIPKKAECDEVLNINNMKNLDQTLKSSCFAMVIDTNGLFLNPNKLDDIQDVAQADNDSSVYDRYYMFIASDGIAQGNPRHILSAKSFSEKTNL